MKRIIEIILSPVMKLMLSCKEATFLVSKQRDADIKMIDKIQLKIHLMTCKDCRHFEHQIDEIEQKLLLQQQELEDVFTDKLSDLKKLEIKNNIS